MIDFHNSLPRDRAELYGLVLASAGIEYRVKKGPSGWRVRVDAENLTRAIDALDAYFEENPGHGTAEEKAPSVKLNASSGLITALVLLVFYLAVGEDRPIFFNAFGSSASAVLDGEIYRTVTSLLLHVDAVHLLGNMAGIALFGSVIGSLRGMGIGWLMILLSGALGNLANAWLHQTDHLAVGASTAVFGAVGMLSAYQFWNKITIPGRRLKAWLPIAGGLALLGIFGSGGGRVDLLAHFFGFLAGIILETGYRFGIRRQPSIMIQWASLIILIGIVSISWYAGTV
ncbi:MAG: rhomboid family intramembrane serine protease [Desulfobacterales bacterium]